MKRLPLAVALLSVIGCGGGGGPMDIGPTGPPYVPPPPPPPVNLLVGNWILLEGTGGIALDFTSSTFVLAVIAVQVDNSVEIEETDGVYATSAGVITFTASKSTCPGMTKVFANDYTVTTNQLVLADPSGSLFFQRNTSPGGVSAVITNGCFDSAGTFTPSPLAPI